MHAPATPGDSVPGDAAGDDSGQGSEPEQPEETPVARRIDSVEFGTPGDLRTLEVTDYCYATHLTPNEKFVVILNGAGLDDIPYIHLDYLKNGQMSEITIFRSAESTSNRAVFESSGGDTPEQAFVKYIEYNKEYFFNMRNSYNRIRIDLSVNDESMGTTTGGGIAYYDFDNEISAVANDGYHFVQWSDGETEATRKINSFEDVELQAIFEANAIKPTDAPTKPVVSEVYVLSGNEYVQAPTSGVRHLFNKSGDGATTVKLQGSNLNLIDQIVVGVRRYMNSYTYTITPQEGSTDEEAIFVSKEKATDLNFSLEYIKFGEEYLYNAADIPLMCKLDVSSADQTMGVAAGSGEYEYGKAVYVAAAAKPGYKFSQWSDRGDSASRTFNIRTNVQYVASFVADEENTDQFSIAAIKCDFYNDSNHELGVMSADGFNFISENKKKFSFTFRGENLDQITKVSLFCYNEKSGLHEKSLYKDSGSDGTEVTWAGDGYMLEGTFDYCFITVNKKIFAYARS